MGAVLQIDVDGAVVMLPWPAEGAERRQVVRMAAGASADAAVYHRRTQLRVHGNGQSERPSMNLSAWVLASVWRGVEITYGLGLYGTAVVTGSQLAALDELMAREVRAVCVGGRGSAGRVGGTAACR